MIPVPRDAFNCVSLEDRFTYDGDLCFQLYIDYAAEAISADNFSAYLQRYVIMRVRKQYLYLGNEICEDLVQSCMLELWKIVRKKSLPQEGVGTFHAFLNTVIKRKISKTFDKEIYDDAPKELDPQIFIQHCLRRVATPDQIEDEIFLQELPDHLRTAVGEAVLFQDEDRRAAVGYVLECLLTRTKPIPRVLRTEYGVRDITFIVDYTKVAVRRELYEVKKTLRPRSNADKRESLYDGIEEYFGI